MQTLLRISDAAVIALHTADYLARAHGTDKDGPPDTAAEIAARLNISYNHLSKVLQQLTKAGLLKPERGPKGGFMLSPAGRKARVRDFISAIDGPPSVRTCLLKHKVCGYTTCVFSDFLKETNRRFEKVLNTGISRLGR